MPVPARDPASLSTARGTGASGSSSNAAEAAAAAEFASKKYVWVPDKDAGYLSAWVVKEDQHGSQTTVALQDGSHRVVPTFDVSRQNPPRFELSENIADLTFLSEAGVSHCLRQRYQRGLIYTYSGLFLVAVNPYHQLPIYTDSVVAAYKGRRKEENAPHVFAVADEAMRSMLDNRENQSLLITGESGAGKTENTKKVIQYLAAVASDMAAVGNGSNDPSRPPMSRNNSAAAGALSKSGSSRYVMYKLQGVEPVGGKQLGLLERQILQANPILEAFGNAQTIRNNNSSRFGKFVRIEFTSLGAIAGANIDWYLLEKSRVHNRSEKERNFHVFYQLLRSGDRNLLSKLLLTGNPADYHYLKISKQNVDGLDDALEWKALKAALDTVGFTQDEQLNFFRVVAACLQVGNIELADDKSGLEQARINNAAQVEKICHLLGVPEQEFSKALLKPRVKAGREWVTQSRTRRQVIEEMAALCKTMYEKTFGSIVERINQALDRPTSKSTFIGVLDIAGFEIFETNSFEQLCINYTNEKLQQFFNHHMFVLEQEEYARENIEWDFVNFGLDLQPTIDLIESTSPIGILSCLDEECIMPKASDETFTEKCNRTWATKRDGSAQDQAGAAAAAARGVAHGSTKYIPARFATGFTIKHYAGNVEYRTEGWLDKNKDPLNDNLTRVMADSNDRFIASLFSEFAPEEDFATGTPGMPPASPMKRRPKRGAFRTLAQKHKEQLTTLMNQLGATQPHFVRCIVPNAERKPGKMDLPLVLEQLRCNGVLEGIRIARLGYPNRLLFNEFRTRYEVLTPDIIPRGYMDGRKACQRMVEALQLDRDVFKIGLTKIFFKAGVLAELEERRDALLYDIFARFQAACRMFTARRQMRKILNRATAVRTIQRNARLYVELREWPWWQLYTKVRPLLTATRQDEEIKRKEVELALITERAERDQREREALEALRSSLESEKQRIETDLANERALLADKDALLARTKQREASLEDEVAAMQGDMEKMDDRLERALVAQQNAESVRAELQTAFDQVSEHLMALQAAQKEWAAREAMIVRDLDAHKAVSTKLSAERQELANGHHELERRARETAEDADRLQKRLNGKIAELEKSLITAQRDQGQSQQKAVGLEEELRKSQQKLAELSRQSSSHESLIKDKEAQAATATAKVAQISQEKESLSRQQRETLAALGTAQTDLKTAQEELRRTQSLSAQLQRDLDETRRLVEAKTSEDVKSKELHRLKEQELQTLRSDMATVQRELQSTQHSGAEETNKLRAQLETAQKDHREASAAHRDASARLADREKTLSDNAASMKSAEDSRRAAEDGAIALEQRAKAAEGSLTQLQAEKVALTKQLASSQQQQQEFEDALLELERSEAGWKRKAEQGAVDLAAQTKARQGVEAALAKAEQSLAAVQPSLKAKEQELSKMRDELHTTSADLRKAKSMENKTIVEHVHVLEEAKKLTDRQLADALKAIRELQSQIATLEKNRTRLNAENEDLNREVGRIRRGESSGKSAEIKTFGNIGKSEGVNGINGSTAAMETRVNELRASLADVKRERDEALSSKRRSALAWESAKDQYESRITELERQLKSSQMAHSNTFQNLQELVMDGQNGSRTSSPSLSSPNPGRDGGLRRKLLEELQMGHEALEADIAAKSDLLRTHKASSSPPRMATASSSWATAAHDTSLRNGTGVLTPSAMKRASTDLGTMAMRNAQEETQRLQRQVKEMAIELSSVNQNAAEADGRANHYRSKADEAVAEMQRMQRYVSDLEARCQELQFGGGAMGGGTAVAATASSATGTPGKKMVNGSRW